jgi:type IV pilus assembly protein PilX
LSAPAKPIARPEVAPRGHQQGLVMLIALVMLVAMTMAGLTMIRGTGAGLGIAGNLAFKQTATSVADYGVENAIAWLTNPLRTSEVLKTDDTAAGYYSAWGTDFSPLTYDWTNSKLLTADDGLGNEVRYVVHRLCETAGLAPNAALQKCATVNTPCASCSKGGDASSLIDSVQPYYRITSRVKGPRNTVSYIQVIMY